MTKLLFTLGVIASGLFLGYTVQGLVHSGRLRLPLSLAALRRMLQKVGLLGCMYFSFMATVWVIRVDSLRITVLPALGAFILLLGGAMAVLLARAWGLSRKQTGSYFACGSFSNIGSIGALVVFVFLGEEGFAYVPLYKLFEEIVYFAIGFPVAKGFSLAAGADRAESVAVRLKAILGDVFVVAAFVSIALGATLNLAGVERPEALRVLSTALVPIGTFLLLVSIGLSMKFSSIAGYRRECAALLGLKFVLLPATACLVAWLCGLGAVHDGLPLKVVLILASMPVGFTSLIPPSIYDLDLNLSNACWLTSTLALAVALPALYLLVDWM
jgi:predicted permease